MLDDLKMVKYFVCKCLTCNALSLVTSHIKVFERIYSYVIIKDKISKLVFV